VDTGDFNYVADGPTGNNTGTSRGGLEEHVSAGELDLDLVRDGEVLERDGDHLTLSTSDGLGDGGHNLRAFADTDADPALAITYYYCSAEAEAASTLDYASHSVDRNNFFFKFFGLLFDSHLKLQS